MLKKCILALLCLLSGLAAFKVGQLLVTKEEITILTPDDIHPSINNFPSKGDTAAKVTIVDYFNFSCRYCDSIDPLIDSLMVEFPGAIRYCAKPFPLEKDKGRRLMVRALLASAEQNRYWETLTLLRSMVEQGKTTLSYKETKKRIAHISDSLKLDTKKLFDDMHSKRIEKLLETGDAEAKNYNIRRIPTVIINGQITTGLYPYYHYKDIVEKILSPK
ncbi:MAG: DsbA family protein [Fibrobacteres bacterium]|nr:DsbA family protein [Fibrobacterota bacterium]